MGRFSLPVQITREKDSRGRDIFVALCPILDIVSQGRTEKTARNKVIEAVKFFLEDADPKEINRRMKNYIDPICVSVPIKKEVYTNIPRGLIEHAKATCAIWEKVR